MKKKNSSQGGDNSWKCKNISSNNNAYEMSEWLSDCCLMPDFINFSAISWREQVNFQWVDDEVVFVLDQHTELMMRSYLY